MQDKEPAQRRLHRAEEPQETGSTGKPPALHRTQPIT